jgi:hypothetical protein
MSTKFQPHGPAITDCWEDDDGSLWVENGEYASQVNYCPYCGYKAVKEAIKIEKEPPK